MRRITGTHTVQKKATSRKQLCLKAICILSITLVSTVAFAQEQPIDDTDLTPPPLTTTSADKSSDTGKQQKTKKATAETATTIETTAASEAAAASETTGTSFDEAIPPDETIPEEPLGTVLPEAERKPLEIEGVDHALTAKYRDRYLTNTGRQRLAKALSDSAPYRPYITQQLQEKNVPLIQH